jgi:uncharacterized membrane protein YtjA (UPF0391 family)
MFYYALAFLVVGLIAGVLNLVGVSTITGRTARVA